MSVYMCKRRSDPPGWSESKCDSYFLSVLESI